MVKLYYTSIEPLRHPKLFDYHMDRMQKCRRDKVCGKKNREEQCRSLAAGVLLRYALEQEDISYDQAVFEVGDKGKLKLKDGNRCFFSLSHSGELAVCAVGEEELGVDIENRLRFDRMSPERKSAIGKRCFSEEEREALERQNHGGEWFAAIWTRKESYGKCIGNGIAMDLKKINTFEENYITIKLNEYYICSIYGNEIRQVDKRTIPGSYEGLDVNYVDISAGE